MSSASLAVLVTSQQNLVASALPSDLSGFKIGSGTVQTALSTTVTPSGGRGPYTYLWTYVSGSTVINPVSSTSASTKFTTFYTTTGNSRTSIYKCVVTDANSTVVDSNTVSITIENG